MDIRKNDTEHGAGEALVCGISAEQLLFPVLLVLLSAELDPTLDHC
jgi:hypothetical protein